MKHILFIIVLLISVFKAKSQCFEIQSILVDACAGSQEGQNEMVTFQVGSAPLNTTNLSVNWPNNSWLGLTKNAGTAADVATVNATIAGCGFLKEPTANVLPANAKVLLVTSTSWSPLAQSFVGLSDTLYVIFQTAGNTAGHFANSGTGLRTLSMSFSSPVGCTDAVTYDRALLINQSGSIGAQDGGAVEFSAAGAATYVNYGCQAPFIPLSVDAGADKTICVGSSQSFTATASGVFTSVSWSLGTGASGSFAPSNSLTTIYTPGVSDNGSIKLYCTITKVCGSQTTSVKDSVNLTITPLPLITLSPSVVSICAGQSATVNATANTAVTYTWSTSATTSSVSLNSAGIYTCNASNACGNNSATVSVSISSAPTLSIVSSDVTICASGQTATLSLNGSVGTYSWSTGDTAPTTTINAPGVYSATVATSGCGNAVANISLGTAPLPIVSITGSASPSICAGGSIVLTANSNEGNYLWSNGATTSTVSVNSSSISVTSTNVCGSSQASQTIHIVPIPTVTLSANEVSLCAGQSATVQANTNTAVTYSWSTGTTTNAEVLNSAGVYTCYVSNLCGSASETVAVTLGAAPTVTASASNTLLCLPVQSTTLTATGTSGGTYLWSNGATTSTTSILNVNVSNNGVYTVTLTNSCGQAVSSISITSSAMPTVAINPQSNLLCPGYTGTLIATSNCTDFLWNTSATTNSILATAGVYSVTVSNLCGTNTTTASVVDIVMTPIVITSSSYSICPNETATLTATGGNITPAFGSYSYAWSNSASTSSVNTTTGGVTTVSVTNFCGTYAQTVMVNVNPLNASITADPLSGVMPLVVNFTNNSTNASTYFWDFGNGSVGNTQIVASQTYSMPGTYIAYLTITNGICMDIDSVTINVLELEPTLYVPNAFTPNGDSINDIFWIGATNIKEFHIIIFDRWGLKMFESSDLHDSWTGKSNGKEVPDGCYFYLINAIGNDNKEIKKQGTVTLFK